MTSEERAIALLRALNIKEIEYSLNGGGDSGDVDLERVLLCDGRTDLVLPNVPAGITSAGSIENIDQLLDGIVTRLPEGDWINNEGGYGTIIIRPFEKDEDLVFDVDITFRDEGDYGDDDEDDQEDDDGDGLADDEDYPDAIGEDLP